MGDHTHNDVKIYTEQQCRALVDGVLEETRAHINALMASAESLIKNAKTSSRDSGTISASNRPTLLTNSTLPPTLCLVGMPRSHSQLNSLMTNWSPLTLADLKEEHRQENGTQATEMKSDLGAFA